MTTTQQQKLASHRRLRHQLNELLQLIAKTEKPVIEPLATNLYQAQAAIIRAIDANDNEIVRLLDDPSLPF